MRPPSRDRNLGDDRGAGTLLTFILMPIVMIGIVLLWAFVDLSMLRTKAAGAADLAALAGASRLVEDPSSACAIAGEIAARNSARMTDCTIDGLDLVVEVSVASTGIAARLADWVGASLPPVRHRSRAGAPDGL